MVTLEKMNPEDKLLFALTRQRFLQVHQKTVFEICNNNEIKWDVVFSTARVHGVAPLIYSNLCQCAKANLRIPQDIMEQFKLYFYRNILTVKQKTELLLKVLSFFKRKSIDIMLIKGVALDVLVYDYPWLTVQNDYDIILKWRIEDVSKRDMADILNMRIPHLNNCLPVNFSRIWSEAVKINFLGQDVFVMSPEDLLIAACINSCRKRFFRLKNLCDIAEIINKYNGLKWEEVTKKSKEYQCNIIVYTALLITKAALGCEFPERVLVDLSVNQARCKIIHLLIHYLNQQMSLSSLYPFLEENPYMRKFNSSLILPYVTYNWHNLYHKLKYIFYRKIKMASLRLRK
ncbi:MAG: hypothetical protein HW406_531 [Candidatus Brocadiaceae bacterium]|nr:hypothetical protein [Candidatus Brocadiaceae bacterium]